MANARAKATKEVRSADDAHSIGHEVFFEEVLADEALVEETRLVAEPQPTQESVVGDSNSVEPSLFSNSGGSGGVVGGEGKGTRSSYYIDLICTT
ncbi:hypothetical protein Syun_001715 [Stephania yunnanensis]|uniref:Uncharacterized protein n=1 Tax=Stephania yunnanensis TaxID=152371 RepID=A0AAP0LH79_9MAGN